MQCYCQRLILQIDIIAPQYTCILTCVETCFDIDCKAVVFFANSGNGQYSNESLACVAGCRLLPAGCERSGANAKIGEGEWGEARDNGVCVVLRHVASSENDCFACLVLI